MSIKNIEKIRTAQSAIKEGDKDKALQLLQEAAREDPKDPRPWLLMVWAAPTKEVAQQYLDKAVERNAQPSYVTKAQNWIEEFYASALIQETPPTPGLTAQIRYWLERNPKLVALVYLAILAQAEANTAAGNQQLGMALHGVCLVLLLLHASLFSGRNEQPFLLSLSLTPLIRLMSLTLPLGTLPLIYWYAVIGAPLLLAAYFLIRSTKISAKQIGLRAGALKIQLLIALSGIILGYLEYLVLRPEPLIAEFRLDQIIIPALILLIFTGFLEELIFRGVFQYFAIRYIGRWGIVYVAFVFAVFHLGYRSAPDFLFVFVVALFFSYAVHKSGSILGITLAHGITNIGLYLVFPFILN